MGVLRLVLELIFSLQLWVYDLIILFLECEEEACLCGVMASSKCSKFGYAIIVFLLVKRMSQIRFFCMAELLIMWFIGKHSDANVYQLLIDTKEEYQSAVCWLSGTFKYCVVCTITILMVLLNFQVKDDDEGSEKFCGFLLIFQDF